MALTYTAIATVTVGSGGAANIEFANIPQTYTDLLIKYSARSSVSADWNSGRLLFNSTAYNTNWTYRGLYGTGSAASSENYSNSEFVFMSAASNTASTFGNGEIYIPNYTSSNNKSVSADMVGENNGTAAIAYLAAGLWSNSAAITNIKIEMGTGTIVQHSTATLYGIKNTV